MAAFFSSFKSSGMPKRLLRYALSRLDIFDQEALDLDNLDLAWGMKTVLEFRDVGLKLKKLKKILNLPPTFAIQKAKVLLLRITLPVDIYSSPIQIDIDGIDIRLKVSSKEETDEKRKRREKSSEASDFVPNAADLAQSFLEQQPSAEKQELETALAAENQDLGASLAMSDYENEDDIPYGTGQALSLPAFLTDFLRGIVDRTEIRIQGVTFQLDVAVPVEAGSTNPELVTFQLSLESINIEGVTAQPPDDGEGTQRFVPKDGKRHISLDKIRAFLITEANVFSTLARSPSMPSSSASQSPVVTSRALSRDSTTVGYRPMHHSLAESSDLADSRYPLQDSEDAFNIPYDFSGSSEEDDENDENDENDEREAELPATSLSTPRASIYQEFAPSINPHGQSELIEAFQQASWGPPIEREARSAPALVPDTTESDRPSPEPLEDSFHSSSGSESSGANLPAEDLTQSHVFTHEDAESMYMSAFSQTESVRLRNDMPGAWDSSPESSPRSKTFGAISGPSGELAHEPEPEDETTVSRHEEIAGPAAADSAAEEEVQQSNPEVEPESSEPQATKENEMQDDVPTPRGPTRLVKEILSLESITIYIPSTHEHLQVQPPHRHHHHHHPMGQSVTPNVPGAFSVHGSSATSAQDSVVLSSSQHHAEIQNDKSVEVVLAPLELRFDTSVGFLLAMVIGELLEALKAGGRQQAKTTTAKDKRDGRGAHKIDDGAALLPEIQFTAQEISLLFLEKLSGVADTAERIFDTPSQDFRQDVLLQTVLEKLVIKTKPVESATETSIELDRFRFGYSNADIISFDREAQMRSSVRDAFPAAGTDVSIKLVQSAGVTKCEINTLPLHILLDLQRLDETLSWFGGLSSFLNMGSSMTSSNTSQQTAKSPHKQPLPPLPPPPSSQKPRGVRFDAPISPDDESASSENKVDMRVGSLLLELIGKDCSVVLNTSAVKLVSREEGIGVHMSKVRLAGPYLRNSGSQPPIVAEVTNTRLEYRMTPKDADLERLLELITPSKAKFDEGNDVIMVDTLLRQRRKGPLLRLNFEEVKVKVQNLSQLQCLPALGEEVARLASVAKYLPEDDRPGLLTLGVVRRADLSVDVGGRFGTIQALLRDFETAQITIPALVAVAVGGITVNRNRTEELVGSSLLPASEASSQIPVLMMRIIGDDIEPVINLKLRGLNMEYRVPTIIDILDLADDATPQDFEASLAASVANLGEQAHSAILSGRRQQASPAAEKSSAAAPSKPTVVALAFRDCAVGLNPLKQASKLNIVLTDASLEVTVPKDDDGNIQAAVNLNKVSLLLIDDVANIPSREVAFVPGHGKRPSSGAGASHSSDLVIRLQAKGFVDICQISSAKVLVKVTSDQAGEKHIEADIRDDLLVLETCADSTQTLIALANALTPPTPPSREVKFKTEVMPVKDLLASISIDAFGRAEGNYNFEDDFAIDEEPALGDEDLEYDEGSPYVLPDDESFGADQVEEKLFDAASMMSSSEVSSREAAEPSGGARMDSDLMGGLDITENYFGDSSAQQGGANKWNSARNRYDKSSEAAAAQGPLKVRVHDVHVIWNLFDGYDWQHTRDVIAKTVQDVETKAYERRMRGRRRSGLDPDVDEEETVIGDFLFNSIYIGIGTNQDPQQLAQNIHNNLYGDTTAETESLAPTTVTAATSSRVAGGYRPKSKKLRLTRSKHHKITFELKGVNVDLTTFPPDSGETQSAIDVRVDDLVVFDHIPTSTWKKFAFYDQDAGERPMGTSMAHLELLNVKPVPDVAATEIVLKVSLLPLRLHVDQDALDFITRFFEFKDDSAPAAHGSRSDIPFIQRAEINSIPVQLDFKPKRVDYVGLRSGHTTEFMNFIVLDGSRMTMRHTIIYGISGFERLGQTLNDIWMPDVKRNQLPGVLAGLAPVRSLVNVGSGFKDLIEIPIQEYKRDGRIVRSISKGAAAFVKSTGTELVKLGAKVATGTQYALQEAEGLLVKNPEGAYSHRRRESPSGGGGGGGGGTGWEEEDESDEERKQISLYADQPTGVVQGLRHAYSSLARDLNIARDAIIAVPAEVRESTSATGAAKVVIRHAPTIIFRPAIGATKAIGQTLLGATNSLDPQNIRRMEDKYKSGPGRM